jgi:hypothetical protein
MQCPKCKAEARDIARFCPRCHNTLRLQCPSCAHEQRQGDVCEKCGVHFLKYISAMMVAKRGEAELAHDRIEQRSTLLKNLILFPVNLGIPLIRSLLTGRNRRGSK